MSFSSNGTSPVSEGENKVRDEFLIVLYSMTAVVALFGNIMVCKIVFYSNQMTANVNAFIVNMAISDILGALSIPGQWLLCSKCLLDTGFAAEFFCASIKGLQVVSFYISSITMMFLAIDRYRAIYYPHKPHLPSKPFIWGVWVLTLTFVGSTMGSAKVFEYFTDERIITCRIVLEFERPFDSRKGRFYRVYGIWLVQYLVPLAVTGFLYWRVAVAVWRRKKVGADTGAKAKIQENFKRRTVIMLIVVVVVFALCWLPLHALNFTGIVLKKIEAKSKSKAIPAMASLGKKTKCNNSTVYFFLYWLGISSCCYNPFIYWWFNPDFRSGINDFFSRLGFKRKVTLEVTELSSKNTQQSGGTSNSA